jgi:hypothetical protein
LREESHAYCIDGRLHSLGALPPSGLVEHERAIHDRDELRRGST